MLAVSQTATYQVRVRLRCTAVRQALGPAQLHKRLLTRQLILSFLSPGFPHMKVSDMDNRNTTERENRQNASTTVLDCWWSPAPTSSSNHRPAEDEV